MHERRCGAISGRAFAAGLLIGGRRRRRSPSGAGAPAQRWRSAIGAVAVACARRHCGIGPLGAADRFTRTVERMTRATLDYYEMTQVTAHLHHGPLTPAPGPSGPGGRFPASELVRLDEPAPGRRQRAMGASPAGLPLIVEGAGVAVAGLSFRAAARLSGRASASLQRAMELVKRMDLIREYWWLIVVAGGAGAGVHPAAAAGSA